MKIQACWTILSVQAEDHQNEGTVSLVVSLHEMIEEWMPSRFCWLGERDAKQNITDTVRDTGYTQALQSAM